MPPYKENQKTQSHSRTFKRDSLHMVINKPGNVIPTKFFQQLLAFLHVSTQFIKGKSAELNIVNAPC